MSPSNTTFLHACLAGDALLTDIDSWVEHWHEAGAERDGRSLAEYLGLNDAEYAVWVEQPSALAFIVMARRHRVSLASLLRDGSKELQAARAASPGEAASLTAWLRQTGRM